MNKNVKAKLIDEKNIKIKQKTDKFLKIFIFIFIFGYAMFFTSNIWMPTSYSNIETSKPGTILEDQGKKIQILKWSYSEKDKIIEAVIQKNNLSISDEKYNWVAYEKNKGKITTETIIDSEQFVVVHIKDLPFRWREIALIMQDKNGSGSIKFYVAKKDVEKVKHIENLTYEDYEKMSIHYLIDIYEADINNANKEINKLNEQVADAKVRISEIKEAQKYETDTEKEESNQAIASIENEITGFKNQIDELTAKIDETNKKIDLQKLKLK